MVSKVLSKLPDVVSSMLKNADAKQTVVLPRLVTFRRQPFQAAKPGSKWIFGKQTPNKDKQPSIKARAAPALQQALAAAEGRPPRSASSSPVSSSSAE